MNMNVIFEKTRELGEAIKASEEYSHMKEIEARALKTDDAALTMGKYLEAKGELEQILQTEHPDAARMAELSNQMEEMQQRLQMIDDIIQLNQAREGFTNLINQVNSVLRFIVTGEMDTEEAEGGCSGSCASCGGGCNVQH